MSAQACRVDHDHEANRQAQLTLVQRHLRVDLPVCPRCEHYRYHDELLRGSEYCAGCRDERAEEARLARLCVQCKAEPKKPGRGSHYCADCAAVLRAAADARSRARGLKHKQGCRSCGARKVPGRGNHYCSTCVKSASRNAPTLCSGCGEHPIRAPKKKYCVRCAEVAERARLRRQRMRASTRVRDRRKSKRRKRTVSLPRRLPAGPLGAAIDRVIELEESVDRHLMLAGRYPGCAPTRGQANERQAVVCDRAGVSDRSFRSWRDGSRKGVDFELADRVLQRLDLLWWEVWTPENTSVEEYAMVERALGS